MKEFSRFIFAVLPLVTSMSHAAERELASDGNAARITISDSFICNPSADIKIETTSAAYFDQGADRLQRIVINTARYVLEHECPAIAHLSFTGITNNVVVFEAEAQKQQGWAMQSAPAPLEVLALFFILYQPDFSHLGTASEKLEHYKNIPGIADTYQYQALEKQTKRLAAIVDGDTDKFRAYLKEGGRDYTSFDSLLQHYRYVLNTIERHVPERYAAYRAVFAEEEKTLREDYWTAQMDVLLDDDEKSVKDITANAIAVTEGEAEFRDRVDEQLSLWIEEETDFIQADLNEAPLYEMAWAAGFVSGLPDPSTITTLPKTSALIESLSTSLAPRVQQRTEDLQALAVDIIKESGSSYEDVDTILETGFALAGEFEESGFIDAGYKLIAATVDHIDDVLKTGLSDYQKSLETLEFTEETATTLREQAELFKELSAEFERFTAYQDATENILEKYKDTICESTLEQSDVSSWDYKKLIHVRGHPVMLIDFACELYENGHMISDFYWDWGIGKYAMVIDESGGTQSRFQLQADEWFFAKNLHVIKRLGDTDKPMSEKDWTHYLALLMLPPPSGEPDAQGLRECDKLAADIHDPQKLAEGIDFQQGNVDPYHIDRAIDACIAAVENSPNDARQQFQLGQLLWQVGDIDSAKEYLSMAAKNSYAAASFYQGEITLTTSDDADAFIDALDFYQAAGKGGYLPGLAMYKKLNPEGIEFFKEIPPPSESDVVKALNRMSPYAANALMVISPLAKSVTIKECFQISKTDFFCEHQLDAGCRMYVKSPRHGGYGELNFPGLGSCGTEADEYMFTKLRKGAVGWEAIPEPQTFH